ncbi:MAG: AAA family ATPase [Sulfuricurvum sp.]|uniref:AAA family ATPase n=1 Tax=Sulfuricurvum sp. TaxID=2025608 RepID=UPI00262BCBF3|nr:AAA family ATPase [Sulfuricurvum sp.]MDD2829535.1 AAA family ATPase [Sulfuricurvum sp.]MDD4950467.1 AAA family ATPase [Sulfuricurvum sp.]
MIVGMFLKNYKVYKGLRYIPITKGYKFSAIIGDNGIGKSSILEALDTFFNDRPWNINKESSSRHGTTDTHTPHISIIFLIEKNKFKTTEKNYPNIETISNYLWSLEEKYFRDEAKEFIKIKNEILQFKDTHFLVITGKQYGANENEVHFSTLDKKIRELFKNIPEETIPSTSKNTDEDTSTLAEEKEFKSKFKDFNSYIKEKYSYIYIPVEIDIKEFTKLETTDMQKLMGQDIKKVIREAVGDGELQKINTSLNTFVENIEKALTKYKYKSKAGRINISPAEIVNKIIELFFSIRTLHKEQNQNLLSVELLSAGEKRQAVLDIAEAFLTAQIGKFDREIIIGIDEPEASLNVAKCYEQFEKLLNLATNNNQILLTTHWYGFLPIISKGTAHFITNSKITSFNLFNYREALKHMTQNRKELPDDINLKSLNDLIQSIVSSVKSEDPYNWLICEGSSEKIYFEHYLSNEIKNNKLRILPVGGAPEVKRIFEYLELPLKEKEKAIKGKILCLIDTDKQRIDFEAKEYDHLKARRLLNTNKIIELVAVTNKTHTPPTEIEDCLDPIIFLETLKKFQDTDIKTILNDTNNIDTSATNSYYCLNLRESDKDKIKNFFDQNDGYRKIEFANKYVEVAKELNHTNTMLTDYIKNIFQ